MISMELRIQCFFRAFDEAAKKLHRNTGAGTKLLVSGDLIDVKYKYKNKNKKGDSEDKITVRGVGIEAAEVHFVDFTEDDTEEPFELVHNPDKREKTRETRKLDASKQTISRSYGFSSYEEDEENIEWENLINWLEK